jgi:hypothetical protein
MALTAGQRTCVAAEKGKMGCEILTERHVRYDSCSTAGLVIGCRMLFKPAARREKSIRHWQESGPPTPLVAVEPINDFFVSKAARAA